MICYIMSFLAAAVLANIFSQILVNPHESNSPEIVRRERIAFVIFFAITLCVFEFMAYEFVDAAKRSHLM